MNRINVMLAAARRRENEGKVFVLIGAAVVTFSISRAYLMCYLAGTLP